VEPNNAERSSSLRRRALPVFLAAVSAVLAVVFLRTVMPSAPAADAYDQPVGQANPAPAAVTGAKPSVTPQPRPSPVPSKADAATMCYINTEGVRYRSEPNTMATSYGLAHKGQAFVLGKYVKGDGGNRWAFGDLRGARMHVYLPANRLNC